jgi:hypothetical protein
MSVLHRVNVTFFNVHSKDMGLPFFVEDGRIMGCKPVDRFLISHPLERTCHQKRDRTVLRFGGTNLLFSKSGISLNEGSCFM